MHFPDIVLLANLVNLRERVEAPVARLARVGLAITFSVDLKAMVASWLSPACKA